MSLDPGWGNTPGLKKRFLLLSLGAIGIFLLLAMRLWYLQIINVDRYRELSEKNRIRYVPITAPRGPILDRNGDLLVDNRPAFGVSVLRQEVENRDELLQRLSVFLGVEKAKLESRWKEGRNYPIFHPLPLAEDVSRDVLEKVQENSVELPGVLIEVRPLRAYPHKEMAANLLGYLGEISDNDLQSPAFQDYRPGDFVGRSGLEKNLESYLRGKDGERRVEVDVQGKELRILKTLEPKPGDKVFLTLRSDLQQAAAEAFGDKAGAAVALDVHTGEVLAMVSKPSFDPALFAGGISSKEWVALLRNPRHPLQNKAIRGQYPPGSTFKIITALAALQAGVVSPSTEVDCKGSITLGRRVFRCWKRWGHGLIGLNSAIKESCDVWFYEAGLAVGIDRIAEMARKFGLGQPLGFRLEGEKGGLIPDRDWKRRRFGTGWYDGETAIAAIGQGYDLVTPLQLATMTAAVANGGTVFRPHVVKRIEDFSGKVVLENAPEAIRTVSLKGGVLRAVRLGMEAAVNDPHGTAGSCKLRQVRVAGKTGTAQVVKRKGEDERGEDVSYRFRDH
ncbi:MAG: penicillin-binding protein 2, partial [Desulfuromonadales bacterium]